MEKHAKNVFGPKCRHRRQGGFMSDMSAGGVKNSVQSISPNRQSPKGQKQVPWTKMSQKAVGITEKIVVNGHEAKLTKECTNNDTLT